MWCYIRFAFVRRFNFISWLLWDSGQFGTVSDCRRLCLFNTRPVGRLSVRTLDGSCGFPLAILVVFELCFFVGVVRCVVGPVVGLHSKCAGLTRSPCL